MILIRQGKIGIIALAKGLALVRSLENSPCIGGKGEEEVLDAGL